jgi:hypothetical protein
MININCFYRKNARETKEYKNQNEKPEWWTLIKLYIHYFFAFCLICNLVLGLLLFKIKLFLFKQE